MFICVIIHRISSLGSYAIGVRKTGEAGGNDERSISGCLGYRALSSWLWTLIQAPEEGGRRRNGEIGALPRGRGEPDGCWLRWHQSTRPVNGLPVVSNPPSCSPSPPAITLCQGGKRTHQSQATQQVLSQMLPLFPSRHPWQWALFSTFFY